MKPRSHSASHAPEVHAQHAAWHAEPANTPERQDAVSALEALAEAGDEAGPMEADDTPPLPDHLRTRWEEAYGATPVLVHAKTPLSWLAAVRRWFAGGSSPLAWGGGLAAALLAVMLFATTDSSPDATGVITRGGPPAEAPSTAATPVYVITSGPSSAALLSSLRAAFPARTISSVESRTLVPAGPAIVIDARPDYLKDPNAAINAVEAMDEAAAPDAR